jgi:hypothetical protein
MENRSKFNRVTRITFAILPVELPAISVAWRSSKPHDPSRSHPIGSKRKFPETRRCSPNWGMRNRAISSKSILSRANTPLEFRHIDGDVMSQMRALEVSLPAVAETRLGVARLADRVCEATRQAALEGAGSALSILAADQSPALLDAIRDLANRALARTAIMQSEFDRFRAVTRRGVSELTARQEEPARNSASFIDLARHRARCHGDTRRPVHAK